MTSKENFDGDQGNHDDDLSDMEVNSALGPDEVQEELVTPGKTWSQLLTSLICLLVALGGLMAAAFGAFLILYTLLSRSYIPAKAHLAKDLYFDYTDTAAVATADFTDLLESWGRARDGVYAFPTGTKLTIWLELEAAETRNMNADMFQVVAQIVSREGLVAASVSRPCIVTAWSPIVQSVRNLIAAPAVLLGLWREHQILNVPLFSRYPDQPDKPLQSFRALLKATGQNAQLPHLYSAKVHVKLALGLLGRLLYWIRPGKWNTLALVAGSFATIMGGLFTTIVSLIVWLSIGPKQHAPPHAPPQSDEDEAENDTGKASGMSRESSYSDLGDPSSKQALEEASKKSPSQEASGSLSKSELKSLEESMPSAPKISHTERRRWGMSAS